MLAMTRKSLDHSTLRRSVGIHVTRMRFVHNMIKRRVPKAQGRSLMNAKKCPTEQQLQMFDLGGLNQKDHQQVEEHLSSCLQCQSVFVGNEARADDVIQLLRTEVCQATLSPDPELEEMISRAASMKDTIASTSDTGIADHREEANGIIEEELRAIFASSKGDDEIRHLGEYRVQRVLGYGGMGIVLEAEDKHLRRRVAIKVLRPEVARQPSARERFLREARAVAAIHHEHVIAIHHVGEQNGVPYLVMPLLDGQSLASRLAIEGSLSIDETIRIGRDIADGLTATHAAHVLHRDITPSNIWLEGERGRVKLLDFGIARDVQDVGDLTSTGAVVGSPHYMSPEQINGEPVDPRSDLFSLGVLLYECVTGQRPFAARNVTGTLVSIARDQPTAVSDLSSSAQPDFCDLVHRLLEKCPADRPDGAAEVAVELERIQHLLRAGSRAISADPSATRDQTVTRQDSPIGPRKGRVGHAWNKIGYVAGIAAIACLLGLLIRIATPEGTVIVDIDDGAISAELASTGLVIVDKENPRAKWTVRLTGDNLAADESRHEMPPGTYRAVAAQAVELEITDAAGAVIHGREFKLVRNGEVRIRVTAAQPAAVSPASVIGRYDDERRVAEWLLTVGCQMHLKPVEPSGELVGIMTSDEIPDELPEWDFTISWIEFRPERKIEDKEFEQLQLLKGLTNFSGDSLGRQAFTAFKNLTNGRELRKLSLPCEDLEWMDLLERHPFLSWIRVHSDAQVARLEGNSYIETVALSSDGITPAALDSLARIPRLRCVSLGVCPSIGEHDLRKLASIPRLDRLDISPNRRLTDEGVNALADVERLTYLTAPGLALPIIFPSVTRLDQLEHLNLHNALLSGIDLQPLAELPRLKSLSISPGPTFSQEDLERLRLLLPHVEIQHNIR